MRSSLLLLLLLLLHLLLPLCVGASTVAPLDERLAVARSEQVVQCIPRSGMRFLNATLLVLARPEYEGVLVSEALTDAEYRLCLGRFATLLVQYMAGGQPFCSAFGRTCSALVGEWTREYYPRSEGEYAAHCTTVLAATDEARYYLWKGPAFENELYQCLRVGLLATLPPN